MNHKEYDSLILIGRFQPFHNAHLEIVKQAAKISKSIVIIVGSSFQPRTYKNPFTFDDRKSMIESAILDSGIDIEYHIEPNIDTIYNDQAWAARIQNIVSKHASGKIGVIGHKKDGSSYYLNMFPQWNFVGVPLFEPLDATSIRDLFFAKNMNFNFIRSVVPTSTLDFLKNFSGTEEYGQLVREKSFVETYKMQFVNLPYPPVFVTTDAVVIQSGHVLMIKRRSEPGKGLWALPGGFLNAQTDESVESAMLRELREETGIRVPAPILKGNIKDSKVFDAIGRSARGRTITHAFKIVLPDGELPKVKGADDAEKAKWVPISAIKSEDCFEDHWEIVQHFVGS
jgi:bifunctional NMN adenylyltransferase/nudix hydrolase